jgi:hypothetical protein
VAAGFFWTIGTLMLLSAYVALGKRELFNDKDLRRYQRIARRSEDKGET